LRLIGNFAATNPLALLWAAGMLAMLGDCWSTYYALELGSRPLYEGNMLARWALEAGGWLLLVAKDVVLLCAVGGLLAAYSRLKGGLGLTARRAVCWTMVALVLVRVGAALINMVLGSL